MSYTPQQQVPNSQGLREVALSPKDLIELDTNTFKEIQAHQKTIEDVKKELKKPIDSEELRYNVSFVPPKKQNFVRQQVFLPNDNQAYNFETSPSQTQVTSLKPTVVTTHSYTTPYYESYKPTHTYQVREVPEYRYSYQNPWRGEKVTERVISRTIRKSNGEVINLPLDG